MAQGRSTTIILMVRWIRTSRFSRKNSFSFSKCIGILKRRLWGQGQAVNGKQEAVRTNAWASGHETFLTESDYSEDWCGGRVGQCILLVVQGAVLVLIVRQ